MTPEELAEANKLPEDYVPPTLTDPTPEELAVLNYRAPQSNAPVKKP